MAHNITSDDILKAKKLLEENSKEKDNTIYLIPEDICEKLEKQLNFIKNY